MSSKTKIVVLHMKEIIYTAVFATLAVILIVLLLFMFLPKNRGTSIHEEKYIPGVYTSTVTLKNTALEVEVTVGEGIVGVNGTTGRAIVPSGASTGKFEAVEIRDGNKQEYVGLGVEKAVSNVNTKLADAILGENALNQSMIDFLLDRKSVV